MKTITLDENDSFIIDFHYAMARRKDGSFMDIIQLNGLPTTCKKYSKISDSLTDIVNYFQGLKEDFIREENGLDIKDLIKEKLENIKLQNNGKIPEDLKKMFPDIDKILTGEFKFSDETETKKDSVDVDVDSPEFKRLLSKIDPKKLPRC